MALDPSLRVPIVDARGNINPNVDSVSVADLGCCDSIGQPTDPEATGDGTVIAILKRNRTLLGMIAASVAVLGGLTFIGSRLATDSVTATATAAAPVYAEGADVKLSTDLAGTLRTTAGGGGGGNPTGGFLDSLRAVRLTTGQAHAGRVTVDSILATFTHIGRVTVDSQLPTNNHVGRVSIDSLLDSVVTLTGALPGGPNHLGRTAVDSILANFTHIGRVSIDSLLDSLVTIVGALPTGQNHVGRVAVDSVLGIGTAGQKAMTASVPVVIASDQTAVTVTLGAGQAHGGRVRIDSLFTIGAAGQQAMANSVPVVIASNQSAVSVNCTAGCAGSAPVFAGVYSFVLVDVAGVAAAQNFLCVMNQAGSGDTLELQAVWVHAYSVAVSATKNSIRLTRVTTCTVGTLQAAAAINKFRSAFANATAEVRTGNPTVTAGAEVIAWAPNENVTAAGTTAAGQAAEWNPSQSFVLLPGEGVVLRQTIAGTTAQTYVLRIAWAERQ